MSSTIAAQQRTIPLLRRRQATEQEPAPTAFGMISPSVTRRFDRRAIRQRGAGYTYRNPHGRPFDHARRTASGLP
ncbi:MAG: hypothetical protein D6725_07280 [Planctomycetota bacterium]|nr:MAG: hypothetical protein D6725_07280 [Planctomycetota bacterium]